MSDKVLYNNIVKLYPNFSLYGLYLRYHEWDLSKRDHSLEDKTLYNLIKDMEFSVIGSKIGEIIFSIRLEDIGIWKNILPESNNIIYKSDNIVIKCYNSIIYDALVQIAIDQSNPSVIRPYINSSSLEYKHTIQPKGDHATFKERYVNYIRELDPSFSIKKLHDNLVSQYNMSIKLRPHHMFDLVELGDSISNVVKLPDELQLYNADYKELLTIDDPSAFKSIIANLYSGINSSTANYKGGLIYLDTYTNSIGF